MDVSSISKCHTAVRGRFRGSFIYILNKVLITFCWQYYRWSILHQWRGDIGHFRIFVHTPCESLSSTYDYWETQGCPNKLYCFKNFYLYDCWIIIVSVALLHVRPPTNQAKTRNNQKRSADRKHALLPTLRYTQVRDTLMNTEKGEKPPQVRNIWTHV